MDSAAVWITISLQSNIFRVVDAACKISEQSAIVCGGGWIIHNTYTCPCALIVIHGVAAQGAKFWAGSGDPSPTETALSISLTTEEVVSDTRIKLIEDHAAFKWAHSG